MNFDFIKAQMMTADVVVPLAIWLMVLWFLAVVILLIGSEPG